MKHDIGTYAIVDNDEVQQLVYWDGQSVQPGGGTTLPNNAVPYMQRRDKIEDEQYFYLQHFRRISPTAVLDEYVATLSPKALELIDIQIERQIEHLREKEITSSPGQILEYQQKLEEALRVIANPNTAIITDFPMLAATEVAINGLTLIEAAQVVLNAKIKSQEHLIAAAAVRTSIKRKMKNATSDLERYNIFKTFDFNDELQHQLQLLK